MHDFQFNFKNESFMPLKSYNFSYPFHTPTLETPPPFLQMFGNQRNAIQVHYSTFAYPIFAKPDTPGDLSEIRSTSFPTRILSIVRVQHYQKE